MEDDYMPQIIPLLRHPSFRLGNPPLSDVDELIDRNLLSNALGLEVKRVAFLQEYEVADIGLFDLYLLLFETSLCFVLHRILVFNAQEHISQENLAELVADRDAIVKYLGKSVYTASDPLSHLLSRITRAFRAILRHDLDFELHDAFAHATSIFVVSGVNTRPGHFYDTVYTSLASLSPHLYEKPVSARGSYQAPVGDNIQGRVKMVRIEPNHSVYISNSCVVATTDRQSDQDLYLRTLVLGTSLRIHAIYNKCHHLIELTERAVRHWTHAISDADTTGLLTYTQLSTLSIRMALSRRVAPTMEPMLVNMRVLLRLDEVVDTLDAHIVLMEREVERHRELGQKSDAERALGVTKGAVVLAIAGLMVAFVAFLREDAAPAMKGILTWVGIFGTGALLVVIIGLLPWKAALARLGKILFYVKNRLSGGRLALRRDSSSYRER